MRAKEQQQKGTRRCSSTGASEWPATPLFTRLSLPPAPNSAYHSIRCQNACIVILYTAELSQSFYSPAETYQSSFVLIIRESFSRLLAQYNRSFSV